MLNQGGTGRVQCLLMINPIAIRTAKTLWSFGCSECNRIKTAEYWCNSMFDIVFTDLHMYAIMGLRPVAFVGALFYVHLDCFTSKVMWGQSVNLTTLFLGRLRPPKRLTSTSCTYFRQ